MNELPAANQVGNFGETRWTMVVRASKADSAEGSAAIEYLYNRYRDPLLKFLRAKGQSMEQAEDLLHIFFERLISHSALAHADRGRGKFRTFLCNSLRNLMVDQWRKSARRPVVSLDGLASEGGTADAPDTSTTPDREFDRVWAAHLLQNGVKRLREEYSLAGKLKEFEDFQPYLSQKKADQLHGEVAEKLNMSEGAFKTALSRFRQRYRAAIEHEIADTLADPTPSAIEEEKQSLLAALKTNGP